ncbi:MAG: hypothetical protein HYY33_09360 [Chloroflexi bacterium]|nr:hypothetical protein [Chloroflexota bacterium]
MSKIAPRFSIPDEWAAGRCPACGARALQIAHLPSAPDQVTCEQCGFSCEVEENGTRIRPSKLPPQFDSVRHLAVFQWLAVSELRALAARAAAPAAEAVPTTEATDWIARAEKLYQLGNSLKQINSALANAGATPPQAKAAMARVIEIDQEKRKRNSRSVMLMGSAALIALLILAAVGSVVVIRPRWLPSAPTQSGSPLVSTAARSTAVLPLLLRTLIPPGITVLDSPTPSARLGSGPAASKCPATPLQAAQLFGGDLSTWSKDEQTGGWMMIVDGPATIDNANFVAVSCP